MLLTKMQRREAVRIEMGRLPAKLWLQAGQQDKAIACYCVSCLILNLSGTGALLAVPLKFSNATFVRLQVTLSQGPMLNVAIDMARQGSTPLENTYQMIAVILHFNNRAEQDKLINWIFKRLRKNVSPV